jgi:transcriptional regulator with XRE-family HTH domain
MTSAQLREWLKVNRRTQQQLADDLGVHVRTVVRWIGGGEIPRTADLAMRYLAEHYRVVAPE